MAKKKEKTESVTESGLHPMTVRITDENYKALEEMGVIQRRGIGQLVNQLLSTYIKTGSLSTMAIESFSSIVSDEMEKQLGQIEQRMNRVLYPVYQMSAFDMRLLAQNPETARYIPFARKKSRQDLLGMMNGRGIPTDLSASDDDEAEDGDAEESENTEIENPAEIETGGQERIAASAYSPEKPAMRFDRGDDFPLDDDDRREAMRRAAESGDAQNDVERRLIGFAIPDDALDDDTDYGESENPEDVAAAEKLGSGELAELGGSEEDSASEEMTESQSDERSENANYTGSAADDESGDDVTSGDEEPEAEGESPDEVELTQNMSSRSASDYADGDVCAETGMTVNRHAYDTGLPDSAYHVPDADRMMFDQNPGVAAFVSGYQTLRKEVADISTAAIRVAMEVANKNYMTPEEEQRWINEHPSEKFGMRKFQE